jgi:hypothetical protein
MVGGNPRIMLGFLGKITIRKAYFYGMHVDLVWYGKRGIKKRIKRDRGTFPCIQRL